MVSSKKTHTSELPLTDLRPDLKPRANFCVLQYNRPLNVFFLKRNSSKQFTSKSFRQGRSKTVESEHWKLSNLLSRRLNV